MKHGILSSSIIPMSCTCSHIHNLHMYCCAIYSNTLWRYIATYCTSVNTLYLSVCFNLNYSWLLNSTAVCSLAAMTNILAPWAQCYMVFKTSSVGKPIKKISGSCCTPNQKKEKKKEYILLTENESCFVTVLLYSTEFPNANNNDVLFKLEMPSFDFSFKKSLHYSIENLITDDNNGIKLLSI